MEFRIACHFTMRATDFHEGIRCRLIDRSSTPSWQPSTLEEVDVDAVIHKYLNPFLPGGETELNLREEVKRMAVTSRL
jgi:hypothetical protein